MLKKRWKISNNIDEKAALALADSLNISVILAKLLLQRGVHNFFDAKKFFRSELEMLYDPYLMDGMEVAAKRVIEAITKREKICVFGDYDVDGTCSAAIVYLYLKELGSDVQVYIPNRLTDGYGISKESIEYLRDKKIDLMISVDCGITAVEEIDYAKQFGIDVIICDHHQPKEKIPDAVAVLDPIKPGCNYPFKFLSGAGVAFKLTRAVAARIGQKEIPLKYLDLVALAGAADIVSLTDENRVLVKKGLEAINKNPRPGIKALIDVAGLSEGEINSGQVVFSLAPRINAVGRMGDAQRAVELFITENQDEAYKLARILEEENIKRREIDEMTFSHAVKLVEENKNFESERAIILHNENWHSGVIGIVASRLVEKYYRPTIMLTTIDGVAKGSARSISGFNIYEALNNCKDLLIQFGGHEAAAGISIELDKIEKFKIRFNEILKETLTDNDVMPEIKIDSKIHLSEISPKFLRILEQFAPFGPGNMRPVFLAEKVCVNSFPKIVGNGHLIFSVKQNGNDKIFDIIGFGLGEYYEMLIEKNIKEQDIPTTNLIDIVFTIEKVQKNGLFYPQLRLKDLKLSE
jgi:single-stranded-DNA-specific exonuclease